MKKIYLGADHAGFKLKEQIKKYLEKSCPREGGEGYKIFDCGALKYNKKDDYPDFAEKVAKKVAKDGWGILVCGSSHGVCIAANKLKGARAVAVSNVQDAKLTREHNDANILCLSGWNLTLEKAKKIINIWLKTEFSKEKRHKRRIEKIKKIESRRSGEKGGLLCK